jgi:hypothetical protein
MVELSNFSLAIKSFLNKWLILKRNLFNVFSRSVSFGIVGCGLSAISSGTEQCLA